MNVDRGKTDVHVEPVEQRPGEFSEVSATRLLRTAAGARRVSEVAAGTPVGGTDDEGARREPRPCARACDAHLSVFERLTERLERVASELRQLVQEEDAVVGE